MLERFDTALQSFRRSLRREVSPDVCVIVGLSVADVEVRRLPTHGVGVVFARVTVANQALRLEAVLETADVCEEVV